MSGQAVCVVGAGRFGSLIASRFDAKGNEVVVIDRAATRAAVRLGRDFDGRLVEADGQRPDTWTRETGGEFDVLVVATREDATNLLVAEVARQHAQLGTVVCRVDDPERVKLFRELGFAVVCPAEEITGRFLECAMEGR